MAVGENYVPHPEGDFPAGGMICIGGVCSGHGVPDDSQGRNGYFYIDLDSDDVYIKTNGAWTIFTGSGGGSGPDVKFNSFFDPNGNVTGSVDDIYVSSLNLGGDGSIWFKRTGNGTNTGWE